MAEITEAAVLVGPARLELQEFRLPPVGRDSGVLLVEECGVCGSDLQPYLKGGGPAGRPREIVAPVVLGHEIVGRIATLGPDACTRWGVDEGDRVLVERWLPCRRCQACDRGAYQHCIRRVGGFDLFYGGTSSQVSPGLWGGFARHMYLHPDTIMHKMSPSVGPRGLSLFLPLANALAWVGEVGGLGIGQSILVEGCGPVGLACVLVARALGAKTIVLSGTAGDSRRLATGRALGATASVVVGEEDLVARCREVTGGEGVDVVIDATAGASFEPVEQAVASAKNGGRVVVAAHHQGPGGLEQVMDGVLAKTLTLHGVRSRSRTAVRAALTLLADAGFVESLRPLCDPVVELSDTGGAFEAVLEGGALHASVLGGRPDGDALTSPDTAPCPGATGEGE